MKEILRLTLKREYFAQIANEQKHTEYRERKPYWRKRLEGKKFKTILFRNGYGKNVPEMLVEFRGLRRYGKGRAILRHPSWAHIKNQAVAGAGVSNIPQHRTEYPAGRGRYARRMSVLYEKS